MHAEIARIVRRALLAGEYRSIHWLTGEVTPYIERERARSRVWHEYHLILEKDLPRAIKHERLETLIRQGRYELVYDSCRRYMDLERAMIPDRYGKPVLHFRLHDGSGEWHEPFARRCVVCGRYEQPGDAEWTGLPGTRDEVCSKRCRWTQLRRLAGSEAAI